MNRPRRFTSLLNIHPGEERLISLLILLYFVLAVAFVLVQSMAFGVFIAEYGPQGLPYSYINIAIFASLAAILYIKVGERVSFSTALLLNLAFLGLCSFLVWLGLKSPFSHQVSFLLPLLFQIVVNLGNLAVWSLAGRLFNFQQAKRLFPLLGAGLWLANSIGGVLVPVLVSWIGAANLLLLAAVSMGLAILVLRNITRSYLGEEPPVHPRRGAVGAVKPTTGLFQNRYVLLIFAYVIVWWVAFFFLDNIFSDRAAAQFPDVNQLTAFMGQLLSITGIVAFFSSTFLSSRIIGRFGLRAGLAGMPLLVTFALGAVAISSSLGGTLAIVFGLGALAKLVNVAFGFSLSQSANAIVYQSLPDTIRGRVQATAEGVVQPIAIGLAGLSLLALTAGLKLDYLGLSYVFLGIGVIWLIVISLLSGGYVTALTQAITRRRLGESPSVPADPTSIALLQSRLQDPHPGVVLYALNKLEKMDPKAVVRVLPELIQHPDPDVRREGYSRTERLENQIAAETISNQLTAETVPSVKEAGLRALGAIAEAGSHPMLLDALEGEELHALRGALIGLLKYQDAPAAKKTLQQLFTSTVGEDRLLAAQVLGELGRTEFQQMHITLLSDPDPNVRQEAIESAGRSRLPGLYRLLIEACDSPETSRAASLALINIGADAFPEIEAGFVQPDAPRGRLLALAKVIGRTGGPHAKALLLPKMGSSDSELRSQILIGLSESGYRTRDHSEINAAVKAEAGWAARACGIQADIGDSDETALLSAALQQFTAQARERLLLLLSFLLDSHSILSVRDAFLIGSTSHLAYALEIIDTQLPADRKRMVMPVLEDLSPRARLERLAAIIPQPHRTTEQHLRALIDGPERQQFTKWVRICAIHTVGRLTIRECTEPILHASTEPEPLVQDTARWALARLGSEEQKGNQTMLSTIEKVIILKTVEIFSKTPDDVLADVAGLLEEMDVSEKETIIKKGDPGDSMYVIVDGRVRVHDGDRLINYLGERDVFGEMALLDPEPRLASVTAEESTRLFRLEQAPFYQLMAERPEVATGIIRVLTRRLRERVRDISQLDSQIKELERSSSPKQ